MSCDLKNPNQKMDDFLLGKLSREEAKSFEVHTFGCPECLEELRLREQMVHLIKEEREALIADYAQQKSSKQKSSILTSIKTFIPNLQKGWVYAGAAVAILLLIFLTSPILFEKDISEINRANFEESPWFESLLKNQVRSSGISASILSPAIGKNFKNDIVFRWNIQKNGKEFLGPFDLKIMNNKEAIIHSAEITGNQYELKEGFEPGLYYWVLEENSEMIFLGKFFVKKPDNLFIPPPK